MQANRLPSFFKTPAHRRFSFSPRYYDERKEALERRIAAQAGDDPAAAAKDHIRAMFRDRRQSARTGRRVSNVRLTVIILVLAVISILIFH